MRVAAETNETQNEAIKEQSQETLTRLTYENMLNTVTLTARNVDGEFWTMRHDFTMLAHQVQDVSRRNRNNPGCFLFEFL